jgi:uncharacterized repeat protein (TIGR01451 family)
MTKNTRSNIRNAGISIAAFIVIFVLMSCEAVHAAGTLSGTAITGTSSIGAANALTANSNAVATTVVSIYGIATNSEPIDSGTTTGGYKDYAIRMTNNANISDTIRLVTGAQSFGAAAGTTTDWSVEADDTGPFATGLTWNNSGTTKAAQTGDYISMVLGPGAQATFTIRITAAANAGDGATMAVPISLQTVSAPSGRYTGYNSSSYGGLALAVRTAGALSPDRLTTTIQGAIITLAKSAAITAPTGYTGAGATPVPGSKITYTITYGNSGASNASSLTLIDSIPTNTTYLPGTISTSKFGSQTDASGDDNCDFNVSNPSSVTCNVGTVNTGENGLTVQYRVTIN